MQNIYILVKFELNEGKKIEDWKPMSDHITEEMKGEDGLFFRDSAVDDKGNVYCIIKWESKEKQEIFRKELDKKFEENPEIMKAFGEIANMETMDMSILNVI